MEEKQQFDEFLGGKEKLPRDAYVLKLASARASEMAALTYSLENPNQNKLIFQKLPIHMRRRVMSHNAKRMPRKLRNGHLAQMKKSGLPPKTKRPSRKYRRRPQNLLLEYNRRQRNKFWLETHIWHAKRFKMIEKWGCKIPHHSNDRCFRANYRAVMNHCLIQDISYYTCIEIKGPENILKQKLKMHCNPSELTFGAKIYMNGGREGTIMFYKKNSYPCDPIGYIHFMWKSNHFCTDDSRAVWLWVHPAFYSDILEEIILSFNFKLKEDLINIDIQNIDSQEKIISQDKKKVPSDLRMFLSSKIPCYFNEDDCELLILRNCLNRFRLCGPLTLSVLTEAFKTPNIESKTSISKINKASINKNEESIYTNDSKTEDNLCQMDVDTYDKPELSIDTWYKSYYESRENSETFKIQKNIFNSLRTLKSPNQLPPNMIVALTVLDPRFFFPQKRTKSILNLLNCERNLIPLPAANISPLWDNDVRNFVTRNCMSTTVINNLRSQSLVPGVQNDQYYDEDIMHKIPIILIQKPGNYNHNNGIGFGSGIDIILPAGWSMPFWLSLILRCARPGGFRESKSIAYENSNLNFPPINHLDTAAYKREANYEKLLLTEKYFKLPPNKRVNYIKFGISSPFFCEWNVLMKEWNDSDTFYVLRDRKILSHLRTIMSLNERKKSSHSGSSKNSMTQDLDNLVKNQNCFVPVKVTTDRKGLSKKFSIICLPTQDDLLKYKETDKWSGPVQSFKTDSNEEKRKTLRTGHLALLKRLKRQRVRAKKKFENASSNVTVRDSSDVKHLEKIRQLVKKKFVNMNKTLIDEQAQAMANLYLPKCTSVRYSNDREVIGYVTQGDFSFSEAKGVGLGYVVLTSLLNLIKETSNIVLTRNTTTRKFRICRLEILD